MIYFFLSEVYRLSSMFQTNIVATKIIEKLLYHKFVFMGGRVNTVVSKHAQAWGLMTLITFWLQFGINKINRFDEPTFHIFKHYFRFWFEKDDSVKKQMVMQSGVIVQLVD